MSRGRFSRRALDAALPVARARGQVMLPPPLSWSALRFFHQHPVRDGRGLHPGNRGACTVLSRKLIHGISETLAMIMRGRIYSRYDA